MKIAIANNLYYPFNRGGAEAVVKTMVTDLKSDGHEVFLITTKPKKSSDTVNQDLKIYQLPSDYYNLAGMPLIKKIAWHFNNLFSYRNTNKITKILAQEKPDLIMTHNLMGLGFRLPIAIRKLKIKHEHYLHDIQLLHPSGLIMLGDENIINSRASKFYQYFTRHFFASPDKIISPSQWLLDQHLKKSFFKNSETEIKNVFSKINTKEVEKIKNNRSNFLFIGQIEYHKGITLLIEAFKKALLEKPELKLTIVGNGLLLEVLIKDNQAEQRIKFLGRIEGEELKEIMRENDCLVVSSLCYENAPTTIFEAHANNLNVLAADIGGIPEIINSNDELFKPGDIDDLKNKILNK